MNHIANFFEDFEDVLRTFFELHINIQEEAIKLCNEKGQDMAIYDLAILIGSNESEAEHILQTLAIMIYEGDDNHKRFIDMLNVSQLPQNIKANIVNFTTKLNETGKYGFKVRYFVDASNIEEASLLPISHTVFLKTIKDYNKEVVCHAPAVRLEFTFDKSGVTEHAVLSIEQLHMLINQLADIYIDAYDTMELYHDMSDDIFSAGRYEEEEED